MISEHLFLSFSQQDIQLDCGLVKARSDAAVAGIPS